MYTQNNEEQIILDYFKGRDFSELTVLDIGANDGITFSNSLKVIEMGWKAHLIEPSPKAFDKLSRLHGFSKNVSLYPIAITETDGLFDLYESSSLLNQGDVSLVSSIKQEETKKWESANVRFSPVKVMGMSFQSFTLKCKDSKFNLISIDVEGHDFEVLSSIDLDKVGCEMLIVEFNGKNEEIFTNYVSNYGMKLFDKNPENLIFVR